MSNKPIHCNCPHCGGVLVISAQTEKVSSTRKIQLPDIVTVYDELAKGLPTFTSSGWTQQSTSMFESELPMPNQEPRSVEIPTGGSYKRSIPARSPSVESDVSVPFFNSLIASGIGLAISGIVITGWLGWKHLLWSLVFAVIVFTITWILLTTKTRNLWMIIEEITDRIIPEKEDVVAEKDEAHYSVTIKDEKSSDPIIEQNIIPDVTNAAFQDFCYGVIYLDKKFGRDEWARNPNKIMSETSWKVIIEHCMENAYVTGIGIERKLTRKGNAVFKTIADARTRIVRE